MFEVCNINPFLVFEGPRSPPHMSRWLQDNLDHSHEAVNLKGGLLLRKMCRRYAIPQAVEDLLQDAVMQAPILGNLDTMAFSALAQLQEDWALEAVRQLVNTQDLRRLYNVSAYFMRIINNLRSGPSGEPPGPHRSCCLLVAATLCLYSCSFLVTITLCLHSLAGTMPSFQAMH